MRLTPEEYARDYQLHQKLIADLNEANAALVEQRETIARLEGQLQHTTDERNRLSGERDHFFQLSTQRQTQLLSFGQLVHDAVRPHVPAANEEPEVDLQQLETEVTRKAA